MERTGDVVYAYPEALEDDSVSKTSAYIHDIYPYNVPVDRDRLRLRCSCLARNKEHAIKITNDIRTQIIAANNWHDRYKWKEGA